jgi:hypothetical protein
MELDKGGVISGGMDLCFYETDGNAFTRNTL